MEIEEIAEKEPDSITRATVDPGAGMQQFQAREIAFGLGLDNAIIGKAVQTLMGCYRAFRDLDATRVVDVEVHLRSVGAVEAFGKDAGDGSFARAARTAEQIGVRDALLLDGIGQCLGNMLLPHDIAEALRAILSGYDLICHLILVVLLFG
jgi:hypothetical protein